MVLRSDWLQNKKLNFRQMKKLLFDLDGGMYTIVDQARDPLGGDIQRIQSAEMSGREIEVSDQKYDELILEKIIIILKAFGNLRKSTSHFSEEELDGSIARVARMALGSGNSKIYLASKEIKIYPNLISHYFYQLSQLTEELSSQLKSQYPKIPWHFLKEFREVLSMRAVKGNYDQAKGLIKSFVRDLEKSEIDGMLEIFEIIKSYNNGESLRCDFQDHQLENFAKIATLVGFYEDINFVADRGYRDEQDVTSHFELMTDQQKREELINSPAGRLAILRFFEFIAEGSKKVYNPRIKKILEDKILLKIRNAFLSHVTADKMLNSLIPMLNKPEYKDLFKNLLDLANEIVAKLQEIIAMQSTESRELSAQDLWQKLRNSDEANDEQLNMQAIDDLVKEFEKSKGQKCLGDDDFQNFISNLKEVVGLDIEDRKLSKSEQKKQAKGQELQLESFDELIKKFQEVNKAGQLFDENGLEKLWQIFKKFGCRNAKDDAEIRKILQEKLSEKKKSLDIEKSSLGKLNDVLSFIQDIFGEDIRFYNSDNSLEDIIRNSSQRTTQSDNERLLVKIRKNYRQAYYTQVTEKILGLTIILKEDPIKRQALELLITIVEAIAREVEKGDEFKEHLAGQYKFACSDHSRNRIAHQQSNYFEAEIPHETAFETISINNHPGALAQTLLLIAINLKVVVKDALEFLDRSVIRSARSKPSTTELSNSRPEKSPSPTRGKSKQHQGQSDSLVEK
jgi:hypothetical protein